VNPKIAEPNTYTQRLRADYKGAFDEWALEVGRLQAASDGLCLQEAEARVSAAETAYRNSRDRLMDHMIPSNVIV